MALNTQYVIVGAGSAGCVLANRLVDAGKDVVLIEAGPKDNTPFVHMPGAFVRLIGTKRTYLYRATPDEATAGRVMFVPQGRMLGGSSSVNAMVYIRGQSEDYDEWKAGGCTGWGWDDVLPEFKKSEANEVLSEPYHGTDGPLSVSVANHRHPLSSAFVKAAQEAGISHNSDFNGKHQEGVGYYQTTTFSGKRGSTATKYLKPILGRKNLTVQTDACVTSLILEDGKAVGVNVSHKSGDYQIRASEEVILTAGALSSPKLLMLSGIGPGSHLNDMGIAVHKDLHGVGQNFQDHLEVSAYGRAKNPISLMGQDRGLRALYHGLQYKLFGTGLLTSTVVESGAFVDTGTDGRPDIQFHVLPVLAGDVEREPLSGHGISLNPCYLRPKSRGQVKLAGPDASLPIDFQPGYLSHPDDIAGMMRGLKLARTILRQPSMKALISQELLPSADDTISDEALEEYIRAYAKTVYHPVGTCKMGTGDDAVVDLQLRVRGVKNLRICDASIMPKLISGNTNAPTIMIAERCAKFILGK